MKIVVTGGAGFIGSHVVDAFVDAGHDAVVIDSLYSGARNLNPKAKFYEVDVRDKAKIEEVFSLEKPDVLNHHAAQMDVRKSVSDPVFDAEVNILGLLNLMEAGRQNGLKHVIFASSGGAIYGDATDLPTPEMYRPKPASPYGISKLTSEYYLDFYYQAYQIPYVALRYGNVYGPRQNPHGEAGVVAIFSKKMLKNEPVYINGDGEQSRDFVFVEDVVRANLAALKRTDPLVVNIGTGKNTTVNFLYDTLVSLTKTTLPKNHGPAKPGEQQISQLDISLAYSELGWKPATTLTEGLTKTVDFFKNETEN